MWVSRRKGGFQTSCQCFFLNLIFYDQLSPRLTKCDDSCFLGVSCLFCWKSTLRDTPTLVFPGGGKERKPEQSRFGGGSFPSLRKKKPLPVGAHQPEELRPEAAVSHPEGFHSCTAPELCVIQKPSKTMAIPARKIYFSVSVVLSITVECRNAGPGNPRRKEAGVACGAPALTPVFPPFLQSINYPPNLCYTYFTLLF